MFAQGSVSASAKRHGKRRDILCTAVESIHFAQVNSAVIANQVSPFKCVIGRSASRLKHSQNVIPFAPITVAVKTFPALSQQRLPAGALTLISTGLFQCRQVSVVASPCASGVKVGFATMEPTGTGWRHSSALASVSAVNAPSETFAGKRSFRYRSDP